MCIRKNTIYVQIQMYIKTLYINQRGQIMTKVIGNTKTNNHKENKEDENLYFNKMCECKNVRNIFLIITTG